MHRTPPTLVELIESVEASAPDSQLDRVAVAVRLAEELSALGDDLVGHFVESARDEGSSWAEIGQRLGITRQAAQQKFVATRQGAPKLFARLGEPARRAVDLAHGEARRFHHEYLGTEHVLLGLMAEGKGAAARALAALGASIGATREQVEEIIGKGEPSAGSATLTLTARTKRVFDLAVTEASAMGDDLVGTEHLLLGLAGVGEGVAAQILHGLGADEQRVRLELSALLGRPCPPARRRRRRALGRST